MALVLSGCAFKNKTDPFEPYNRRMYTFNKVVDSLYIKPVAKIYDRFLPKFFKTMVNNFFQNLSEIPTIANDLLQFKFAYARSDAARFVLNTTWGLGGLFDVAAKAGRERHHEDFGQTLAFLGYKKSSYFVLPIFGPSTVRDGAGRLVNYYLSAYPYIRSEKLRYALLAGNMLDTRVGLLKVDSLLNEESIDEYTFVRDAFLQHRQAELNEGKTVEKLGEAPNGESSTGELEGPPE